MYGRRAPRRSNAIAPYRRALASRPIRRKKQRIYRSILGNKTPTFVETFQSKDSTFGTFQIPAGGGIGRVFKVRISDIPQFAQYANLYTQYRINWVKVIVVPDFNTSATEENASQFNTTVPTNYYGMARVVHSIQDSPNQVAPATEQAVLEDNGCKIGALKSKWMCSFRPVPDISETTAVGTVPVKSKFKSWYNFDTTLLGNNPLHGAVTSYWSLPGGGGGQLNCTVYYKVSFSLRDPQ